MNRRKILTLAFVIYASFMTAAPADAFSHEEETQIFVPTPHLWDRGESFDVNLSAVGDDDYSFPLPVGKAQKLKDNVLRIYSVSGDAVKAAFSGVVRLSRRTGAYGNVIVVRHTSGIETVYAGNAENLVHTGDKVHAGQTIAIIGRRGGRVALDFSVLANGGRINPEMLFETNSHRLCRNIVRFKRNGRYVAVFNVKDDADEAVVRNDRKKGNGSNENKSRKKAEERTSSRELATREKMSVKEKTERKHYGNSITSLDPDEEKEIASSSFIINLTDFSKECWAYPLPGSHVISPYGGRRNHGGVDIKTCPNDKILAAFDGVVTRSSPYFGYGNCIVIRHAYGFETLYSHQSRNLVKVGQHVHAGDVIGLTGRTGRATTEHLHFEVHYRGRRINPNILFNHSSKGLRQATLTLGKNGRVEARDNYFAQGR